MAALDLVLNEGQLMLRDAVQRLCAQVEFPSWQDLSQHLGLAGLTLPEQVGGFGGGAVEVALVMAELGPSLAGANWLSHAAACLILGEVASDHPLLPRLAEGSARAAFVSAATAASLPDVYSVSRLDGTARLVAGGAEADVLVVAAENSVLLVATQGVGVTRECIHLHDGSRVADIHFANAELIVLPGDGARATAIVRVGRCAEAIGLMQRIFADTADYLNQRKQFGAPLGSFQALRHRLADMKMDIARIQALAEAAIVAIEQGDEDSALALAAACIVARDAARSVGEGAVQLHGAMGLTEELKLGARFKRLLAIGTSLGSEVELLDRYAAST